MGSSTVIDNIATMAEDKKNPLKSILKNIKCKLGMKKDKQTDKKENRDTKENREQETRDHNKEKQKEQGSIVDEVLENFRKLELEARKRTEKKKEDDELKNFSYKAVGDNEQDKFTYKVVEEDRSRTESLQSQDSGFSEKDEDDKSEDIAKEDDEVIKAEENKGSHSTKETSKEPKEPSKTHDEEEVIDSLQNLKIEDGKKKKVQKVPVPRGPIRKAGALAGSYHPYETEINTTVNRQTFSGGQVIVANRIQEFAEIQPSFDSEVCHDDLQLFTEDLALHGVQFDGPNYGLDIVQEFLDENKQNIQEAPSTENLLHEFFSDPFCSEQFNTISDLVEKHIEEQQNPIEELENQTYNQLNYEKIEILDSALGLQEDKLYKNIYPTPPSAETAHSPSSYEFYSNFLTPPRSETIPSPMSDSIYQTSSDCVLSPNSDCEKYQEIPHYEEFPALLEDITNTEDGAEKVRERNPSTSSLTLKNYKDLQKELAATFSKKECCQINRKSCKELFQVHMKRLKPEDRRNLCLKVSSMDLKTIYGVLHHVLLGLSRGDGDEDLHMALFALLCEKALGTKPQLFLDEFGLSLLKAACLRCPQRPLLVRYVVQCVRAALRHSPALGDGKDYLFKEVDALGDTLVIACARAGDVCGDVLSEILRTEHGQRPLFNVQHVNTEGYSALHVACREHSASCARLYTAHVLLEHGGADIWKGDVKGGDSAAHMAVNSPRCDLPLVLLLFKHLDRKEWKKLAHQHNRSSVTPLDYARCAAKSTTRTNYPIEVLEFLKKCR